MLSPSPSRSVAEPQPLRVAADDPARSFEAPRLETIRLAPGAPPATVTPGGPCIVIVRRGVAMIGHAIGDAPGSTSTSQLFLDANRAAVLTSERFTLSPGTIGVVALIVPLRSDGAAEPWEGTLNNDAFMTCRRLLSEPSPSSETVAELHLLLLSDPSEQAPGGRFPARAETAEAYAALVDRTRAILCESMGQELTLESLARRVHSSRFNLCRIFRGRTGLSIHEYLLRLRVRETVDRLAEHRGQFANLAAEMGFGSHSHLCDVLRRQLGLTPRQAARDFADRPARSGEQGRRMAV